MYKIAEWKQRYEVSIKGREPKDNEELRAGALSYIRLKVYGHRQGAGYRRLLSVARDKTMEVFGIFCKFLEISGNQPRDKRGILLNEKDEPATPEDLAFILDIPLKQVTNALSVLSDPKIAWIVNNEKPNSTELNTTQVNTSIQNLPEKSGKRFEPPTLEQIKDYIKQNNYDVNAEKFLKYFTESNWVDSEGKKVKNWKQKIITWSGSRVSSGRKNTEGGDDRRRSFAEQESNIGKTI